MAPRRTLTSDERRFNSIKPVDLKSGKEGGWSHFDLTDKPLQVLTEDEFESEFAIANKKAMFQHMSTSPVPLGMGDPVAIWGDHLVPKGHKGTRSFRNIQWLACRWYMSLLHFPPNLTFSRPPCAIQRGKRAQGAAEICNGLHAGGISLFCFSRQT